MAGEPATTSAASALAPLPEGARAVDDVDLKDGGVYDGRRACDNVGRQQHSASHGGIEGRRRRQPQGRPQRRRQEGMRRRRPPAPRRLSRRGRGPSMTSASRAAASTAAGGPATTSAARATAPLPEGARAVKDVGLKGRGGGRRACNTVDYQRHGASPEGDEGCRRRWPQGRRRLRRKKGLQRNRPPASHRLSNMG